MNIDNILAEIRTERVYQRERWGTATDDTKNTPWMWASYICQYATRWMVGSFAPLKHGVTDNFRTAMVKVATLAIAAIESVDRQRSDDGRTFYEEGGE